MAQLSVKLAQNGGQEVKMSARFQLLNPINAAMPKAGPCIWPMTTNEAVT